MREEALPGSLPLCQPDIRPADQVVHFLIDWFEAAEKDAEGSLAIPLRRKHYGKTSMQVTLDPCMEGFLVSNLGTYPLLPWLVFVETIELLCSKESDGYTANKGNTQAGPLGSEDLPMDSVEGWVASRVYGKKPGDRVFRRITPVTRILTWAGICEEPDALTLRLRPCALWGKPEVPSPALPSSGLTALEKSIVIDRLQKFFYLREEGGSVLVPGQGGRPDTQIRLQFSQEGGAVGFATEGGFLPWDRFFQVIDQLKTGGGKESSSLLPLDILVAAGLCLPRGQGWVLGEAFHPVATPILPVLETKPVAVTPTPLTPQQRQRIRAAIRARLGEGKVAIPLLRGSGTFEAQVTQETDRAGNQLSGIRVDNLGKQHAFLLWEAFEAVLELLNHEDRPFLPGIAQAGVLGSEACPLDSVEGYVARTVYGRQEGESCFMRIVPLRGVLLFCDLISRKKGRGGQGMLQLTEKAKNLLRAEE